METGLAYIVVEDVAVLMPGLALRTGRIEVSVAVGIEDMVGAEQAGQCPADFGILEDLADFGNTRQYIVADIALFGENFFE